MGFRHPGEAALRHEHNNLSLSLSGQAAGSQCRVLGRLRVDTPLACERIGRRPPGRTCRRSRDPRGGSNRRTGSGLTQKIGKQQSNPDPSSEPISSLSVFVLIFLGEAETLQHIFLLSPAWGLRSETYSLAGGQGVKFRASYTCLLVPVLGVNPPEHMQKNQDAQSVRRLQRRLVNGVWYPCCLIREVTLDPDVVGAQVGWATSDFKSSDDPSLVRMGVGDDRVSRRT